MKDGSKKTSPHLPITNNNLKVGWLVALSLKRID